MLRFSMKGKLTLRYMRPFEVTKRVGHIAYKLSLPLYLAKIQNMFHVSLLRQAKMDSSWFLPQVPLEIKENVTLEVKLVKVLDQSEKKLKSNKILLIKVLWRSP